MIKTANRPKAAAANVHIYPFDPRDARWNDPVSLAALAECEQMKKDPNTKRFKNMKDLIADLESDDD